MNGGNEVCDDSILSHALPISEICCINSAIQLLLSSIFFCAIFVKWANGNGTAANSPLAQVLVSILSQDAVNTNVLASDEVQRELGAALAKITFLKGSTEDNGTTDLERNLRGLCRVVHCEAVGNQLNGSAQNCVPPCPVCATFKIEHAVDPSKSSLDQNHFQFGLYICARELIDDPSTLTLQWYRRSMNLNIIKLERLPSLLLIWTQWNEHASEKEIKRLMDLISDTIDLDELYLAEKADENESSVRHLISMSATNGEGHIVFKTVGEGEWVALSKDANIERLDSWDEVTKSCCSKGLIPNVFLYEEVEVLVLPSSPSIPFFQTPPAVVDAGLGAGGHEETPPGHRESHGEPDQINAASEKAMTWFSNKKFKNLVISNLLVCCTAYLLYLSTSFDDGANHTYFAKLMMVCFSVLWVVLFAFTVQTSIDWINEVAQQLGIIVHNDQAYENKSQLSLLVYLRRTLEIASKNYSMFLYAAIALVVLYAVMNLMLPDYFGRIIDSIVNERIEGLYKEMKTCLFILLLQWLSSAGSIALFSMLSCNLQYALRTELFKIVVHRNSDDGAKTFINDSINIASTTEPIRVGVFDLLQRFITLLGSVVMCSCTSYELSPLAFVYLAPIVFWFLTTLHFVCNVYGDSSKARSQGMLSAWNKSNNIASKRMIATTHTSGHLETRQYNEANEEARRLGIADSFWLGCTSAFTKNMDLVLLFLILFFGGKLAFGSPKFVHENLGSMPFGTLVKFQLYWNMVKTSYQALHEISTSFTRPISAMNKVSHLVDSLAKKPIGAGDGRGTGAGETRGTDI